MQAVRVFLSPVQWAGFITNLGRRRPRPGLRAVAIGLALVGIMAGGYLRARPEVTLIINGQPHAFRTRQTVVRAILREAGLELHPEDIVSPGREAAVRPGQAITVQLARPARIEADGRMVELRSHTRTLDALLAEACVRLRPHDRAAVARPLEGDRLRRQLERALEQLGDLACALARQAVVVPKLAEQAAAQRLVVRVANDLQPHVG